MRDFIRCLLIGGVTAVYLSLFCINDIQAQAQEATSQDANWIWPTDGEITDTYGTRQGTHKGIDIAAEPNTPIYAVDGGIVSKSYYSDTYGHVIFIKHQNKFETVYAHLNKRNVSEGQIIHQGELIGQMGNTGDSSGVHLHFEVHLDEWTYSKENAIDPDKTLGATEIGQVVYAQKAPNADDSIETAGHPYTEEQKQPALANKLDSNKKQAEFHIVQAGETLWSIAQQHNNSVELIILLNDLQDQQIYIGQELDVRRAVGKKYMVENGDTLLTISKKIGKSVEEIKKTNQLISDTIFPKQILIVE